MRPVCLIVLDGWGTAQPGPGNAISAAAPLRVERLMQDWPHTLLEASGTSAGLLPGYIGNSEVGHLHIGAGRLVKQDLARINEEIKNGKFFRNKALKDAMQHKRVHLLGLVSDAGVHSHISHLFALIKMAQMNRAEQVYVHAITDGRDTRPKSAIKYISQAEKALSKCSSNWKIATIIGRYYAMDRDNRWNREHKAYDAMANSNGLKAKSPEQAVTESYRRGETDEFIKPTIIEPEGRIRPGDAVIFFNFRSDRARELARAFVQGRFNRFRRKKIMQLSFTCLTEYDPEIKAAVAYLPQCLKNSLGEVIAANGLRQFRIAETEKWAHVTYFFNGLSGKIFKNEERCLIPSPKVATYDKKPEMSALAVTKKTIEAIKSKKYSFMLVNLANPDMVGHTGNIEATIKALKFVDECAAYIVAAAQQEGADIIITADHGNAEQMLYPDGTPCTAHTTNKVPFIIVTQEKKRLRQIAKPCLYHIAPTLLQLMGIQRPKEMEPGLLRK